MTSSLPQVQEQQGRPIGRRPVSVKKRKKNDNFTKGDHRAQETWGHLPSRRAVDSAQCPRAPVTLHYTCTRVQHVRWV